MQDCDAETGIFYSYVGVPRLHSAHLCPHLFRNAGFLFAALKLVHVRISTAFKCGVCMPRVLSVYGGATVTAFSIVTMTLYRWSSQSLRIIVIGAMHAHSIPRSLPR